MWLTGHRTIRKKSKKRNDNKRKKTIRSVPEDVEDVVTEQSNPGSPNPKLPLQEVVRAPRIPKRNTATTGGKVSLTA